MKETFEKNKVVVYVGLAALIIYLGYQEYKKKQAKKASEVTDLQTELKLATLNK